MFSGTPYSLSDTATLSSCAVRAPVETREYLWKQLTSELLSLNNWINSPAAQAPSLNHCLYLLIIHRLILELISLAVNSLHFSLSYFWEYIMCWTCIMNVLNPRSHAPGQISLKWTELPWGEVCLNSSTRSEASSEYGSASQRAMCLCW